MSIKIKTIKLKGIRGAKESINLPLNSSSIVLYGDNGTGKSSITDSIEWFYTDKVEHLSGNEIDLKDAMRNAFLDVSETSEVAISFSKSLLDNIKSLAYKKNTLVPDDSNTSDDFKNYIADSEKENLLLRYQYLTAFINATKGEKLKYLSDIIGFSEVTKKKEVLQKSFNSIKSEIKNQNFESLINIQKQILIQKLGASISQEKNLYEKINEIIKPLKIGIEVNSIADIDKVLEQINKPSNNKLHSESKLLGNINSTISVLSGEVNFIDEEYTKYFSEFEKISSDVQSIMQTFLAQLLNTASDVITKKYHKEQSCPVCLQTKSLDDLQSEIKARLKEIEESSKKKAEFDKAKQQVVSIVNERIKRLDTILFESELNEESNKYIKDGVIALKSRFNEYLKACEIKVISGLKLTDASVLKLKTADFDFHEKLKTRANEIQQIFNNDNSTIVYSNITASKDAFLKIKQFERQQEKLENQRKSLQYVYNAFVKKQKEALENFINLFSDKINAYYQYMNPGELFQEIKIVTIGEEDELTGITIGYKYNGKTASPPQKYFSESHLNCFGLSFFLASVEAFNEKNAFFILDDVISSFDSTHRKKFADLVFDLSKKFQIILFTHEYEWFKNIVSPLAKKNNWLVKEIKWTDDRCTHFDESPKELKEIIESNLAASKVEGSGNPIRIYLEQQLKDICLNLDVKVSYRTNEVNEKRMADELISELKSRIQNKSKELGAKIPIIDKVANSAIFGNLLSHDNPFNPKIGDLKAFWADILEFEKIFYCQSTDCKKPKVSIKNLDTVANKIRCGCDHTKYDWK